MTNEPISKTDRDALLIVLRKRDKTLKAIAAMRKAANMAEFEKAISKEFRYDEDGTIEQAVEFGAQAIADAQAVIEKRCNELGIPGPFQPRISWRWASRGENVVKERRAELRLMAKQHFEAQEKQAIANMEIQSLSVQEKLISSSLTTDQAREFLEGIPKIEELMPPMNPGEVQQLIEQKVPDNVKQLASYSPYRSMTLLDAG